MRNKHHILTLLLLLLTFGVVNGQVMIGNGLTISEGTTVSIENLDVIVETDEIKGEGHIKINQTKEQTVSVSKTLDTNIDLEITEELDNTIDYEKSMYASKNSSALSSDILLAKENVVLEVELPILYINIEGKTFEIEDESKPEQETAYEIDLKDIDTTFVMVNTLQLKGTANKLYYNLPIYSYLLNNARFLDNAELYEFECLTALLKPPMT